MKTSSLLLVLITLGTPTTHAQDIAATDVANALDALKLQAVAKIDQDLEANARAFADAKNIQVSARWSDWFSPFLDIARSVYDGLTAISIKQPTSVRSWVKTSLQAANSGQKYNSYRYSLLNDLHGIAGWSPMCVAHGTSNTPCPVSENKRLALHGVGC